MRRTLSLLACLTLFVSPALAGCEGLSTLSPAETVAPANLGDLKVRAESHADSYQREDFGSAWKDVDRNGCGQRDDVLARDLKNVKRKGRCTVVSGTLTDPYTGEKVTFRKAKAAQVQIDHRVALSEAWRSGAWAWGADRLERFANDLDNLTASAGAVNNAKSDYDAANWLPDGASRRCSYAKKVIAVKEKWSLSVDRAEAAALSRAIDKCPA
ncbi:HNH endonuclease family protein [Spongisporangium articulatum]|uniref:HNH endonuclease family protein n=1 Tax=Spongisporangium articulatum TaxID=3362603 RepID=A0ABW8AK16_9ACTN